MHWLTEEDREYLNPMIDELLDACESREQLRGAEDNLAGILADYQLDEVHRRGWSIKVDLPEDGDIRLRISRLRIANLDDIGGRSD